MSILKIFALAIFGVGWLMPLHILPWVSWHSEMLIFMSVFLLTGYALCRLFKKNARGSIDFPIAIFPLLFLGGMATLQGAVGYIAFGGDVVVINLYMALCIMALSIGYHAADKKSVLIHMAVVLIVVGVISSTIALVQFLELWGNSGWINHMSSFRRPGANLGQPNHLATLLILSVVSVWFLYEYQHLHVYSSGLIFIVLTLGIASTESRTGILSILALITCWFFKRRQLNFRITPKVVIISSSILFATILSWPTIIKSILIISDNEIVARTQVGTRLEVWPQLLKAISLKPWLGWGLGRVSAAHNAVVHEYSLSEQFSYAHNILIDMAIGLGIPLGMFLVLIFGIWLLRQIRTLNQLTAWYCIAIVLPVAIHSMVEFPFAYAYFLVPVMFCIGILEGMRRSKGIFRLGKTVVITLFLCVAGLATYSVTEYIKIEEDFRIARMEAMRIGQTSTSYERPKIILLTQLAALLEVSRLTPTPGMDATKLELVRNTALRYPWLATQNRYALALALNGNPEEAIRQLRVIKVLQGESVYQHRIKPQWQSLAQDQYPQLGLLALP